MARRRNPPESVRAKWQLADRLRTIRTELFGERGLAELARRLVVPVRTWYSYETGVTVPAEILLQFIELTRVEPFWLMTGQGPKYQPPGPPELDDLPSTPPAWLSEDDGLAGALGEAYRPSFHESFGFGPAGQSDDELAAVGVATATLALVDRRENELPGASFGPAAQLEPSRPRPAPQPACRCVQVEGNAMLPLLAAGAFVAFSELDEDPSALDGRLVVTQLDTRPIVRWFHLSGEYGVLRAENPAFEPATQLIDLHRARAESPIRRVLWVGTGH